MHLSTIKHNWWNYVPTNRFKFDNPRKSTLFKFKWFLSFSVKLAISVATMLIYSEKINMYPGWLSKSILKLFPISKIFKCPVYDINPLTWWLLLKSTQQNLPNSDIQIRWLPNQNGCNKCCLVLISISVSRYSAFRARCKFWAPPLRPDLNVARI